MLERMTYVRMSVICRQSESMSMHANYREVSEHCHMLHDLDLHACNPQGSMSGQSIMMLVARYMSLHVLT